MREKNSGTINRRESLSAASSISFIHLTNIYSILIVSRHTAGLWEISDDQRDLPSVHRVYNLEVETGTINGIISEIIALKERQTVLVGASAVTANLDGQGELL